LASNPSEIFAAQKRADTWLLGFVGENFNDAEMATRQTKFYAVSSGLVAQSLIRQINNKGKGALGAEEKAFRAGLTKLLV
jgi:hypothetical protein